jgi:hypothetical protein
MAAALEPAVRSGGAEIVAAVDVDRRALTVYAANFPHPTVPRNLDRVTAGELAAFAADLWTLSPPCQPYTRRGSRRDLDDPRAASLVALLAALAALADDPAARPSYLFLENVPGFATSRAHVLLTGTLERAGYTWRETLLCPSDLGWPNRRNRFYLLAAHRDAEPLRPEAPVEAVYGEVSVADLVDPARHGDPALAVDPDLARRYAGALDVVRPSSTDPADAVTACFTSAYGRSPVRSGSYLALENGRLRRFHPREVLALLGFPPTCRLPTDLSLRNGWHLAGNSLSLPAVRWVLGAVPGLETPADPESLPMAQSADAR